MRPKNFDINKVIESVQGTCDTLESHLPDGMEENDLTPEDYIKIDNEIFLCSECGWWCEICQAASEEAKEANDRTLCENICEDCCPEED